MTQQEMNAENALVLEKYEVIKKFDPECNYIKKWLPELENITTKELYKWDGNIQKKYNVHVAPIFNWNIRYLQYCKLFKNIK